MSVTSTSSASSASSAPTTIWDRVRAVKVATSSVHLRFHSTDIFRQEDIDSLNEAFNEKTSLTKISCAVTDYIPLRSLFYDNLPLIVRSILSRPALRTVRFDISFLLFRPNITNAIAAGIESTQTLEVLQLNSLGFDSKAFKIIIEALRNNASIIKIIVGRNKIDNTGAKAFAEYIAEYILDENGNEKSKSCLEVLKLRDNGIGSEGFRAIATALRKTDTLQCLDMRCLGTRVTTLYNQNDLKVMRSSLIINYSMRNFQCDFVDNAECLQTYADIQALCRRNGRLHTAYKKICPSGQQPTEGGNHGQHHTISRKSWPRILAEFAKKPGLLYKVLRHHPMSPLTMKKRPGYRLNAATGTRLNAATGLVSNNINNNIVDNVPRPFGSNGSATATATTIRTTSHHQESTATTASNGSATATAAAIRTASHRQGSTASIALADNAPRSFGVGNSNGSATATAAAVRTASHHQESTTASIALADNAPRSFGIGNSNGSATATAAAIRTASRHQESTTASIAVEPTSNSARAKRRRSNETTDQQ